MIRIQQPLAFLILVSLSLFIYSNIINLGEGGSGYLYLLIALFCFSINMALNYKSFIKLRKTWAALVIFIMYFVFNYSFDTLDISLVKNVTIGTSGGIIFGLLIGLISTFTISIIFKSKNSRQIGTFVISPLISIYFILVLFLSIDLFQHFISTMRSDLFLVEDNKGAYQRPAALMLIQFIISAMLAVSLIIKSNIGVSTSTFCVLILFFNAVVLGALAQLLGSNSGLMTIVGFFVMFIVVLLIITSKAGEEKPFRIRFKHLIFGWIGRKIFMGVILALAFLTSVVVYLFFALELKATQFRIFGFSKGKVSSVDSRLEILKQNFIDHLSYNPIFGNTQVHVLTTGEGTYTHSLLSIFTHLGLVGGILFLIVLLYSYIDITKNYNNFSLYDLPQFRLFRLLALSLILLYALLSAFMTWLPLWFAIGAFGLSLNLKQNTLKCS